mgnify:CR=1 FL=1
MDKFLVGAMKSDPTRSPSTGATPGLWRVWAPWLAMLLLGLISLWLHQSLPVVVQGDNWWDDRLFVELARNITRGNWLGNYGQQTLSKGPIYPVFIAASFYLGIPLKMAEQMLYLGSGGLLCGLVMRRMVGRWSAVAIFALLAFNPVQWFGLLRVLRENIYGSEALLLFTLATRIFLLEAHTDLGRSPHRGWPLVFGGVLAAYWLTREESVWLLPSLGLILLFWLVGRFAVWRRTVSRPHRWLRSELRTPVLALVVFLSVIGLVNTLNWVYYGVWCNNDLSRSPDFVAAYGAITRIKTDTPSPRQLFTHEARLRAYQVSAAARRLEPYLEGEGAKGWIETVCVNTPSDGCEELVSGWLPWMLRDAIDTINAANHVQSALEAEAFYRTLAAEINDGCNSGKIPCGPPRFTLAPPLPPGWEWERKIVERMWPTLLVLLHFHREDEAPWQSTGSQPSLLLFKDMTGGHLAPEKIFVNGMFVRGWVAEQSGQASLALEPRPGIRLNKTSHRNVDWSERPGTKFGLPVREFYIVNSCGLEECNLVLHVPGQAPQILPISQETDPGSLLVNTKDTILALEEIGSAENGSGLWMSRRLGQLKRDIMHYTNTAYAVVMPRVSVLALMAFLIVAIGELRRRSLSAGTVLGAALLGAALLRVALLAWIDVTSFPSLELHYVSPAHPLLLVFCGLSLSMAVRMVLKRPENPE